MTARLEIDYRRVKLDIFLFYGNNLRALTRLAEHLSSVYLRALQGDFMSEAQKHSQVAIETTPNPSTLKFKFNFQVTENGFEC